MIRYFLHAKTIGEGVSKGLSRGLGIERNRLSLLEEGIGIGVPCAKSANRTYFAKKARYKTIEADSLWEITYHLNCVNTWRFLSRTSPAVTTAAEKLSELYMRMPVLQPIMLRLASGLRATKSFGSNFMTCPEIGQAVFTYHSTPSGLHIDAQITILDESIERIFIMTELGGRCFDRMIINSQMLPPPSGWITANPDNPPTLASSSLLTGFKVTNPSTSNANRIKLAIGRELAPGYAWAGFSHEIIGDFSTPFGFSFDFTYASELEGAKKA